jgi:hypothetical protein
MSQKGGFEKWFKIYILSFSVIFDLNFQNLYLAHLHAPQRVTPLCIHHNDVAPASRSPIVER